MKGNAGHEEDVDGEGKESKSEKRGMKGKKDKGLKRSHKVMRRIQGRI